LLFAWKEIKGKLLKNPRVQLVKTNCPGIQEEGKHKSFLGTLFRFHPLFAFPENEKITDVRVIDIDFKPSYKTDVLLGRKWKDNPSLTNLWQLYWTGMECPSPPCDVRKQRDNWISAGKLYSRYKFPPELFLSFLDDLQTGAKNKIIEDFTTILEKTGTSGKGPYGYGLDEHFLNFILRPYMDAQSLKYGIILSPRTPSILYIHCLANREYKNLTSEEEKASKAFYLYIYPPFLKVSKTALEYWKELDNIFWGHRSHPQRHSANKLLRKRISRWYSRKKQKAQKYGVPPYLLDYLRAYVEHPEGELRIYNK
jgi:hypothetical protein